MDPTVVLINKFDLRKLNRVCNFKGCNKIPTRETLIFEIDRRTARKRELMSLYFCEKHYNINIKKTLTELNRSCEKGKIIDEKSFDIGYITY